MGIFIVTKYRDRCFQLRSDAININFVIIRTMKAKDDVEAKNIQELNSIDVVGPSASSLSVSFSNSLQKFGMYCLSDKINGRYR
jgi:hypothetical protein